MTLPINVTDIDVSMAIVNIPKITEKLEGLFRNAHPSKEDRDKILILSIELKRMSDIISYWAINR